MADNLLRVQPIRNGTVIDHIKPGRGKKILDVLELSNSGTTISLLINVASKKKKHKDIIKVEDRELNSSEAEKLSLLSPEARINIIRNYAVAEKNKMVIPKTINNIVHCSNDNCISNNERGASTKFRVLDQKSLSVQCIYCGRKIEEEDIEFI